MPKPLLLIGLLVCASLLSSCTPMGAGMRPMRRAAQRYTPPPALEIAHSIGQVSLWVDPDWPSSARTWRIFMPPITARQAQGPSPKETGLDIQWGCQAFESALRRELQAQAFEMVTRPRSGLYRLEVVMEGQPKAASLDKNVSSTQVWIQASLTAPDRPNPVLILRTPATGTAVQKGEVMRTWNDSKKATRNWAWQLTHALNEVRRAKARSH